MHINTDKPNIIYILADDMGYGDMACNNPDSKIPTPNLDKLAASGMRFTDAHAASSVCTPSRYSILTGRYCWRTQLKKKVLWQWDPALIEPDRLTVAELLRQSGYKTSCIGKWHLGWNWQTLDGKACNHGVETGVCEFEYRDTLEKNIDFTKPMTGGPVDCGFDSYFGVDVPNFPPYTWFADDRLKDLPTEQKPESMFGFRGSMAPGWQLDKMLGVFAEKAVDYIQNSDEKEPFFMYLALTSPHTPVAPSKDFIGKSGAGLYGDFVCETDWVVGQVMAALDKKGITDNTLVIFTSDNGPEVLKSADGGAFERILQYDHYSMAHLRGVKKDTWEGGHRVPFIASWPNVVPAGQICDKLTALIDFMATCADIAGADIPAGQAEDSMSMLELLKGNSDSCPRKTAIHHSMSGYFAVRDENWVLIDPPGDNDHVEPDWFKQSRGYTDDPHPRQLFDLRQDISERYNLYAERADVAERLEKVLIDVKRQAEFDKLDLDNSGISSE